ncbi:DUF6887 family protein [Leptolyngbya sp. NIES-2104]|uniref:DUF6887 family protein n=1 Tax=Leptolyngbya sp. NIES-2104 TaxID=1552121 RepID=UPI00073F1BF8|nr:hypothetical protein [Leptolyngbya sp. NIES-2104]
MNKPNFAAMSQKELRQYVMAHREDDEAFYAYVDRVDAEGDWTEMPADADLDSHAEFQSWLRKISQSWNNRAS